MTATTIQAGDRVCRRDLARKVVGTVLCVAGDAARVDWDRTRGGLVRIGTGRGIDSSIRLSSLCLAAEYVAKPVAGPADTDWQVVGFMVSCDHPSGEWLGEYGVNEFRFGGEAEAREKAAELAAAGRTAVKVSRQDKAEWVPPRCRMSRLQYRWTKLIG
jgi:hypothetical protein